MPPYRAFISLCLVLCLKAGAAENPSAAEWPEFRGPTGQGHSEVRGLPLEWSTTRNVSWKTALPGLGWSSPVVSAGRIFLSTGISDGAGTASLHLLCVEVATGKLLWNVELFAKAQVDGPSIHQKSSPASPTPVVEGDRVYVHFGHLGTACLDHEGRVIWKTNRLAYRPVNGNGSSPVIVDDKLIFNADGAASPTVVALDKATGNVVWQVRRTAPSRQTFSFSTPLLIAVDGRRQLVSPGSGGVSAYDPADGRELWRVDYGRGYSVVPRPVFGHGLVFVATGFDRADLLAIKPEGTGDVTDTHVAWRTTRGAPLTPSVLLVGNELYAVNDAGVATCWDAKTGELHWQEKIDGNYSASPLAADGRIYFQNETGIGTVIAPGRAFRRLATNDLKERTYASYAVTGTSFLIRTETQLYRIGTETPMGRPQ